MNHEANRLQTFQEWPANSPVSPSRIAKAGFYYTGQGQVVQCFLCNTTVSEWNFADQAIALHRLSNPDCPFVLNPLATCNVPLVGAANNAVVVAPSAGHSELPSSQGRQSGQQTDLKRYSHRLATFENWPVAGIVSPERLARSGFYYLQQNDMVGLNLILIFGVLRIYL